MNVISTQKILFPQLIRLFGLKEGFLIYLGFKLKGLSEGAKSKIIYILSFDSLRESRLTKLKLIENITPIELKNTIIESMRLSDTVDFDQFIHAKVQSFQGA